MSHARPPRIDGAAPEAAPGTHGHPEPAQGHSGVISYQRLLAIGNLILFNDELDAAVLDVRTRVPRRSAE